MEISLTFTATYSAEHPEKGPVYLSVTLVAQSLNDADLKAQQQLKQTGYRDILQRSITTAADDQPAGIQLLY